MLIYVTQVCNSFALDRGGAERLVHDLHIDLQKNSVNATIVALERCTADGLSRATSLNLKSPYALSAVFALGKALRAARGDDVIVHGHLFPTSAYIALLRWLGVIKAPCVFTEHSTSNRRRDRIWGKILDRCIYQAFDRIYCISEGTKRALLDAHPSLAPRVSVVENGARLRFSEMPQRADQEVTTILSIGRLHRSKNYHNALRAVSHLKDPKVRYVILGEGDQRRELEALIEDLELSDRVTLAGHVNNIKRYLIEADIFFMPSTWEGFGLAAVEAMNAGLPVVASDINGLRDVVGTDRQCSFLAPPDDAVALSRCLEELLGDPKLRMHMGMAGFERAKRFDKSHMAAAYIAAYESLLRR